MNYQQLIFVLWLQDLINSDESMNFNLELCNSNIQEINPTKKVIHSVNFILSEKVNFKYLQKSLETKSKVRNENHRRIFLSNNEEVKTGI